MRQEVQMDYKEFCKNRGIPVPGEKAKPETETQAKAAERLNSLAGQLRTLAKEKGVALAADMEPEDIIAALRSADKPEEPGEVVPDFDDQTADPAPASHTGKKGGRGK
jgi:hypothetical protein